MALLSPLGPQFLQNDGTVAAFGRLYTFQSGTTTQLNAYQDQAGTVHTYTSDGAGGTYIALDSAGKVQPALWLVEGQEYRLRLQTSAGVTIDEWDDIYGVSSFDDSFTGSGSYTGVRQAVQRAAVTPRMFGAVGDGTTDDTTAVQAWASSSFPKMGEPGTFKVTSAITFPADGMKFDGRGMVVDGSTINGAVLSVTGGLTSISDLSSSPAQDAASLSFSSAHGLARGDVCLIYNPTNSSWSGKQTYYRAGEFFRVAFVSSSTAVKLIGGLYAGYTAANVDVYKMTKNEVDISNLRVIGKGSNFSSPIKIQLATRVRLSNISGQGSDYTIINLDRCYDVDIDAPSTLVEVQSAASKYAISIGNSQHVRVRGGKHDSVRHSLNLGGDDFTGCVPNRDVWVIDAYLANDAALSQVAAADIHGNCEHIYYVNCHIVGGGSFGGRHNHYWNCDFHGYNYATGSVVFGGSEWLGGVAEVRNCRIYGPLAYTQGLVRLFTDSNTNSDSALIVDGLYVEAALCDTLARCDVSAATYKVNAVVRNVTIGSMPNLANVLRMVGTGAAGDGDFVVVENIEGGPASYSYYVAASGYGSTVKARLPELRGTVNITPVSGAAVGTTSVTFARSFGSKIPAVTLTLASGTVNSKTVVPYLSSVSATGFGANMRTADSTNMGVTSPDVVAHWTAKVAEI